MDSIRVSKVERVACTKNASTSIGTVHLTAHHLIFRYDEETEKEMWVPYPLISLVTRLPQTLQGQSPVTFHTRTFETFSLSFNKDGDASDVFESVKELTVATSVNQLYAFFYTPNPPYPTNDGWSLYSVRDEFLRMGVGSRSKAWRFTDINKDYAFCSTYPARMVVPTKISDTTLQYASKYRSKCRIPVLTYLHWANYGSLTRSSQPMVGITQNRSVQDEKLIEAIFQSHWSPETRASSAVYGATATNLIIDARPTANAVANTAKGAGTENMDNYKEGKKAYLGIDNIHIMRDSLSKVVEALREADTLLASINNDLPEQIPRLAVLDRGALRRSGWLRHISAILEGTVLITRNVHVNSSHVLIHCSDGWDRTAQLSSLSQLCLDPFYRTIRGFEILIEKDWLSFGHRFLDRCGHLSSDKFFVSPSDTGGSGGGADAAQAFLASVQNRFASQHHVKETSPAFHQFLETVRQIQRQYPERFEFNERFLKQLYYHLYSCQFGTFLYNCERERRVGDGGPPPWECTVSVWDYLNSPSEMDQNRNADYDPSLDDPTNRAPGADMGVLFPNPKHVRFWNELYGRTDEEMNGRAMTAQMASGAELLGPVEGAEDDPVIQSASASAVSLPPSPSRSPALRPASTRPASSSRSASPGVGSKLRDHSASAPDMSPKPLAERADIFPTFSPSSSLRVVNSPSSSTNSPGPSSPIWSRTKPPDFSGVKSVWGKLSSNASAAFSVVQDAYVGVAKDLRNTGGNEDDSAEKTSELRGRDALKAWGEEPTSQATNSLASLTLGNPWAVTKTPLPSASLEDNPWGTSYASGQQHTNTVNDYTQSSPLPLDPTVAVPSAARSRTQESTSRNTPDLPDPPAPVPPPRASPHASTTSDSDPLGVGLL